MGDSPGSLVGVDLQRVLEKVGIVYWFGTYIVDGRLIWVVFLEQLVLYIWMIFNRYTPFQMPFTYHWPSLYGPNLPSIIIHSPFLRWLAHVQRLCHTLTCRISWWPAADCGFTGRSCSKAIARACQWRQSVPMPLNSRCSARPACPAWAIWYWIFCQRGEIDDIYELVLLCFVRDLRLAMGISTMQNADWSIMGNFDTWYNYYCLIWYGYRQRGYESAKTSRFTNKNGTPKHRIGRDRRDWSWLFVVMLSG